MMIYYDSNFMSVLALNVEVMFKLPRSFRFLLYIFFCTLYIYADIHTDMYVCMITNLKLIFILQNISKTRIEYIVKIYAPCWSIFFLTLFDCRPTSILKVVLTLRGMQNFCHLWGKIPPSYTYTCLVFEFRMMFIAINIQRGKSFGKWEIFNKKDVCRNGRRQKLKIYCIAVVSSLIPFSIKMK